MKVVGHRVEINELVRKYGRHQSIKKVGNSPIMNEEESRV
jgi:hypothetical protein